MLNIFIEKLLADYKMQKLLCAPLFLVVQLMAIKLERKGLYASPQSQIGFFLFIISNIIRIHYKVQLKLFLYLESKFFMRGLVIKEYSIAASTSEWLAFLEDEVSFKSVFKGQVS